MLFDLLGLAGVVLILVGLWWIAPAAALIVGGLALMAGAALGARLTDRPTVSGDDLELAARSEARRRREQQDGGEP